MIETTGIIDPWLWATLSEDATLIGLIGDLDHLSGTLSTAPLPLPYVTFMCQSSRDVGGVGGIRISTDNLYIVKAVAQGGTWDDVNQIAGRIDSLIHRPSSVMTEGSGSLTCVRESIVQYPEVTEGLQYRHLGGIYRIRASADV
jgi:hypothetical protein